MESSVIELLHEMGGQIDRNRFPRVLDGGLVMPNRPPSSSTLGVEKLYERWKANRSPTGSWKRAAGWKGSTGGARTACEATSILGPAADAAYGKQLNDLYRAYPDSVLIPQNRGFWLVVQSMLLPDLDRCAMFLVGVDAQDRMVRSWAFWEISVSRPTWIGPRHTNFNDGSICAFEPTDGTWTFGDSMIELLDYYSVWAVRHLHLEQFGRWPGYQAVRHPYERILEFREDEYCGCNTPGRLYRDCCYDEDCRRDQLKLAINYSFWSGGGIRKLPKKINDFVSGFAEAPDLVNLLNMQ
jgi:hypothetical protein